MYKQNLTKSIQLALVTGALLLSLPLSAAAESLSPKKKLAVDDLRHRAYSGSGSQESCSGFDLSRIYTKVCNDVLECMCDETEDVVISGALSCGEFRYPMYSSKSVGGEGWYGLCKSVSDYSEMPPQAITIVCIEN